MAGTAAPWPPVLALAAIALVQPLPARSSIRDRHDPAPLASEAPSSLKITPAGACALFQDSAATRRANRERRLSLLESIDRAKASFWIVHHGDWTMPQPISVEHLTLSKTILKPEGAPTAIVWLDMPGQESGCRPGLYRLEVDDSLGPDAHVLAIFDEVVLIEYRGQLQYFTSPGAVVPEWHMVWQSPWTLARPRRASGGGGWSQASRRW